MDSDNLMKINKKNLYKICVERNIGRKYKGKLIYRLNKSDLIEFILDCPNSKEKIKNELLELIDKNIKESNKLEIENNTIQSQIDEIYRNRYAESDIDFELENEELNSNAQSLTDEEEIVKILNDTEKKLKEIQRENDRLKDLLEIYMRQSESQSHSESDYDDKNSNPSPPPLERDNVADSLKCPVCLDCKVNTVLTCTHTLCNECVGKLDECPLCRKDINKNRIRYFRI